MRTDIPAAATLVLGIGDHASQTYLEMIPSLTAQEAASILVVDEQHHMLGLNPLGRGVSRGNGGLRAPSDPGPRLLTG